MSTPNEPDDKSDTPDAIEAFIDDVIEEIDIEVRLEDVAQMVIGAAALAIPVAASEEIWRLGAELPWLNLLGVVLVSLAVAGTFIYFQYGYGQADAPRRHLLARTVIAYAIAALVAAAILFLFQKLPLNDPAVALGRVVLVAFPGCFAATVVDSLASAGPKS